MSLLMKLTESPVTQHQFNDLTFFLKRDDMLHSHFSGNKARKFMSLLNDGNFTHNLLVSYGSVHSNAMYSLAALAKIKKCAFEYYVDHIPQCLKKRPIGNYRAALELGAKIIEVNPIHHRQKDLDAFIRSEKSAEDKYLLIPEGGRCEEAEYGIKQLGFEIIDWCKFNVDNELVVALPSGTGTTALYLHKLLSKFGIEVITCACVGGKEYLTEQFLSLNETSHPNILTPQKKHYFGHLYLEQFYLWETLSEETSVEFDLLYDPLMWQCLLDHKELLTGKTLLYIHQGGILGNESMQIRYQRLIEQSNDFSKNKISRVFPKRAVCSQN